MRQYCAPRFEDSGCGHLVKSVDSMTPWYWKASLVKGAEVVAGKRVELKKVWRVEVIWKVEPCVPTQAQA